MLSKYMPKIKVEKLIDTNPDNNEVYLGDQSVIDRLNNMLEKIKNGYYDEETKEKIYYQNEIFVIDDQEEKQNLTQDLKYYMTGWFIHNFFNENFGDSTGKQD